MPVIYSKKKLEKRHPLDFYPTQPKLAVAACNLPEVLEMNPATILDPGAGLGVWADAIKPIFPSANLIGVEINESLPQNPAYTEWHNMDFVINTLDVTVDLVIGNPPYKFTEDFLHNCFRLLSDGGRIIFLLKLSFLESATRYKSLYSNGLNPEKIYCLVQRPNFREYLGLKGSDSDAYGIYIWKKGFEGETIIDWLNWR